MMRRRALGTPQVEVLDRAWIRQRRLTLGMEQGQLAELMSLTSGESIRRLERDSNQAQFTLAQVSLLADALGASVGEMLTADERSDTGPADDIEAVGALLAAAATRVPVDELATALDWTLDRTLAALDGLTDQLQRCGQRLQWVADVDVQVVAAADPGPLDHLSESMVRVRGLNIEEAAELEALMKGVKRARRHGPQVHIPRLVGAGLVSVVPSVDMDHARHNLELTDAARFNLCLDDA